MLRHLPIHAAKHLQQNKIVAFHSIEAMKQGFSSWPYVKQPHLCVFLPIWVCVSALCVCVFFFFFFSVCVCCLVEYFGIHFCLVRPPSTAPNNANTLLSSSIPISLERTIACASIQTRVSSFRFCVRFVYIQDGLLPTHTRSENSLWLMAYCHGSESLAREAYERQNERTNERNGMERLGTPLTSTHPATKHHHPAHANSQTSSHPHPPLPDPLHAVRVHSLAPYAAAGSSSAGFARCCTAGRKQNA